MIKAVIFDLDNTLIGEIIWKIYESLEGFNRLAGN